MVRLGHMLVPGIRHSKKEYKERDVFNKDANTELRLKLKIAKVGQKHHLDRLINDDDPRVREAVADRGFKEHLDKLVNDPNSWVRSTVANHGHPEHLEKLITDPERRVRSTVASAGNEDQRLHLMMDDDDAVRMVAVAGANEDTRHRFLTQTADELVSYRELPKIQNQIERIRHTTSALNERMALAIAKNRNAHMTTHKALAYTTPHTSVMDHLSYHPDSEVRSTLAKNPHLYHINPQRLDIRDRLRKDKSLFVTKAIKGVESKSGSR